MIRIGLPLYELLLRGGTLVVPSRQRAHATRLAFAAMRLEQQARVWSTPDILPAEGWLIRTVEELAAREAALLPRVLSPAEDWLLWRQTAEEFTRDLSLLSPGALADGLRDASALADQHDIAVSAIPRGAGTEAELLRSVQLRMQERRRQLGADTAASLVKTLNAGAAGAETVCAGFLSPSARLTSLGVSHHDIDMAVQSTPRVVIAPDDVAELEQIAHWCREQIGRVPDSRLLVILPGSAGARERLATLIHQVVDPQRWLSSAKPPEVETLVAIEGGAALASLPVVAHALNLLRWLGGEEADFQEVSEWLRAPYWDEPPAGERARLDLWLRERGHLSIATDEWLSILSNAQAPVALSAQRLAHQLSAAMRALGEGDCTARDWSERFRAAVEAVNWPGAAVRDSAEQQTVVRFHELLDEFGQLALASPPMSRQVAIQWFCELAIRTAFRPADADAVVTISAALADPVVQYDGIWVARLHAEAFPQPVQPDPFVPIAMQLQAGVPAAGAAGRLSEARSLLTAWRAATGQLTLSAPARIEDLELLVSPLLMQWQPAPIATDSNTTLGAWLPQRLHRDRLIEPFTDDLGLPWPLERTLPSGTRSLDLQNQCAFRSYAELRLGSSELDMPEPGVPSDLRGRLLHKALELLWLQLRDSTSLAGSGDGLAALIAASVSAAADQLLGQTDGEQLRAPVLARELRRTERLIARLCELEKTRGPFRVSDVEVDSALTMAGATMKLRMDRVDVLEDGRKVILDYKSGRVTPGDWYSDRPTHPQLLAYLATVGELAIAMATVNVTARKVRFAGIARSEGILPGVRGVKASAHPGAGDAWEARRLQWLACVERLTTDFVAGRAVVDPKPGVCLYCHAVSVCRISDGGIELTAELLGAEFEIPGHG